MSNINILTKSVDITLARRNIKHYSDLGYEGNVGDTISVSPTHLLKTSQIKVDVKCNRCNKEHELKIQQINAKNNTFCRSCSYRKNINVFCQYCGERTNRTINGKGICNRHRHHIRRHGEIVKGRKDRNDIIEKENTIEIILISKSKNTDKVAIIDKEDYEKVQDIAWHLEHSRNGLYYVSSSTNGKTKRLHNLILPNNQSGLVVDHINGNGLDNRKQNLRLCTASENTMNWKPKTETYSGIKGVTFDTKTEMWISQITANKQTIRLGSFKSLEDAKNIRLEAEKKHHKEFRKNTEWTQKDIYIMGILEDSLVDGEGVRDVCFVAGCDKFCEGCHNQLSWKVKNGTPIKIYKLVDILLSQNSKKNITISGGDPLSFQKREVYEVVKEIKKRNPTKNIWLYTGMTWEDIMNGVPINRETLKYVDVLVDGRFEYSERDVTLKHRGSKSQRIINVQESLKQNKVVLYDELMK